MTRRIRPLLWLPLLLTPMAVGCTATVVKQYPPSALLEDCTVGALTFSTNKDVAESVAKLADTLKLCNIDKASLRKWAKE